MLCLDKKGEYSVVLEPEGMNVAADRTWVARIEEIIGKGTVQASWVVSELLSSNRNDAERNPMQFRRLGNGPLEVSELSFGTWLTVAGGIAQDQAIRCIHAALDHGITLFDTANQYGAGSAEQILGKALRSLSARPISHRHQALFPCRRRARSRPISRAN